jgi:hypothetical protein
MRDLLCGKIESMMTLGKTNRGWRLLLLVCLAAAPSVYAVENGGRVVGEAHDLESDELLYREIYCANGNPDEMEVIYRDEAGGLIARKVLDYGSGATTPSFVQRNLYSSEIIEVKTAGQQGFDDGARCGQFGAEENQFDSDRRQAAGRHRCRLRRICPRSLG